MPSPLSGAGAAVESIRTLALVGPAAAGKTSLAEAMLVASGAIVTPGSLERGTTVSDFDALERRMQHSLNSSVLHLERGGTRVHFIDTPGAPDFLGQSLPALEAVETAAVVVSAVTGVEPIAVRMMEQAAGRQRDRLIIVNKIDVPGVDLPGVLEQIQAAFGKVCLPVNLPDAGAHQGGRLLLQPRRAQRLRQRRRGAPGPDRAGGRGRRRIRRALSQRGRRRRLRAARAAGAGAARGPPDPGLLRLGPDRRRRAPSCSTSSSSCCRTRPNRIRPSS